jgi:hypothetical protein
MTQEIPEADRQEQEQSANPFEVSTEGVVQPSTSPEAAEADRIDQATPVPLEDEGEPQ